MYQWLIFTHILAIFGFLIAHGASAAIVFKLRGERETARVQVLLELSRGANGVANACLLVFLAAGIIAGFMGNWWGQLWIWAALGLLIALSVFMTFVGSRPLIRIRRTLESAESTKSTLSPVAPTEQRLGELLAATHPWLLTTVSGGSIAVILWLMMFKPF